MIVVADTSPINYLVLIEEITILQELYERVIIPTAVRDELLRPIAPQAVREWVLNAPEWLEVREPANRPDASLAELDPGERDAIALAIELNADQLIVDDRKARRRAEQLGIAAVGTVGVLREAASQGLLDIRKAVALLQRTSFHITQAVLDSLLKT
jgi:predicted nucleic acid-binding protein